MLTPEEQEIFVKLLRKTALDVADDGTGTHLDTLRWQAADEIERLVKEVDKTRPLVDRFDDAFSRE